MTRSRSSGTSSRLFQMTRYQEPLTVHFNTGSVLKIAASNLASQFEFIIINHANFFISS